MEQRIVMITLAAAIALAGCEAVDDELVADEEDPAPTVEDDGGGEESAMGSDEGDEPAPNDAVEAEPEESAEQDEDDTGARREDPMPVGETAAIAGWEVTVQETVPDGTDFVLAENEFNDPPAEGRQFYLVRLSATFTGDGVEEDSGQFWLDVTTNVVDDNNVTYSSYNDYCGVIPDALEDTNEVFEGGTVEGHLCWSVDSEAAESLVMFAESTFSLEDDRTWFALR